MELTVVPRICGFVPQQISVCACRMQSLIALPAPLTHGKRHSAVGMAPFELFYDTGQDFVGVVGIFPSLQYEGPKAQVISFISTGKDFFRGQPVSLAVLIAFPDPAVNAIVLADIADLDEPAGEDGIPIDFLSDRYRCIFKKLSHFRRSVFYQESIFADRKRMHADQLFRDRFHIIHITFSLKRWNMRSLH